jgi:lipopolysaccharide export system protein LptA
MKTSSGSSRPLAVRAAVVLALMLGASAGAESGATAVGQGVPNAMQGFSQNRDQPITIEAAVLELRDRKKQATFSGNVKMVQGDTTMTSKALLVFYDSDGKNQPIIRSQRPGDRNNSSVLPPMQPAPPGPGGSSSIRRLEARSHVVVTQKDQTVTGEKAVFDLTTNLITMLGSVVLTQCNNVLRGDRLQVDMTTGVSRIEMDHGKVQGLLEQSATGCGQHEPAPKARN